MKERPILFSAPMVRAILAGRKTQTRRMCKKAMFEADPADAVFSDGSGTGWIAWKGPGPHTAEKTARCYPDDAGFKCPYGQVGDSLWVRETWARALGSGFCVPFERYEKDDGDRWGRGAIYKATPHPDYTCLKWKPSIHMPRWASRITLEVTGVRVERLQDISEKDAEGEGVGFMRSIPDADETLTAKQLYMCLWDAINGQGAFDKNPWVWVVDFQKMAD